MAKSLTLACTLLSSLWSLTSAGPACVACMTGCMEVTPICAAGGPAAYFGCLTACNAFCLATCAVTCFDPSTTVYARNASDPTKAIPTAISSVEAGSEVLMLDSGDGAPAWTKVISNKLDEDGSFDFVEIETESEGGEVNRMRVTANHVLAVYDASSSLSLSTADGVRVGDRLPSVFGPARVRSVAALSMSARQRIHTEHGLLVADAHSVTSVCADNFDDAFAAHAGDGQRLPFTQAMRQWRQSHHPSASEQSADAQLADVDFSQLK